MDRAAPSTATTALSSSSAAPASGGGIRSGSNSPAKLAAIAAAAAAVTAGAIICGIMAAPAIRRYRAQREAVDEVSRSRMEEWESGGEHRALSSFGGPLLSMGLVLREQMGRPRWM